MNKKTKNALRIQELQIQKLEGDLRAQVRLKEQDRLSKMSYSERRMAEALARSREKLSQESKELFAMKAGESRWSKYDTVGPYTLGELTEAENDIFIHNTHKDDQLRAAKHRHAEQFFAKQEEKYHRGETNFGSVEFTTDSDGNIIKSDSMWGAPIGKPSWSGK